MSHVARCMTRLDHLRERAADEAAVPAQMELEWGNVEHSRQRSRHVLDATGGEMFSSWNHENAEIQVRNRVSACESTENSQDTPFLRRSPRSGHRNVSEADRKPAEGGSGEWT